MLTRAVGLLGLAGALVGCPNMGVLLRQHGYTELRPPSQLMAPGTMVWVQNTKPFQAGIICTQEKSLGSHFVPMQAPTANAALNKAADTRVDVGAEYMQVVKAKASLDVIENVQMELHNPVIYTVNDVDIVNNAGKRDPVCAQAVRNRARAGFAVTMISSALMADVTFHVQWKTNANIDVETKIGVLNGLAPHLGLTEASVSDRSVSGKNMFWGVVDDIYLAQLSANGADASGATEGGPGPMPPREQGAVERAIPAEAIVEMKACAEGDVDAVEGEEDATEAPQAPAENEPTL